MSQYGNVVSATEVRFECLLPGPIETVWAFLTGSRKRGEWVASGPMELRVGGKVPPAFWDVWRATDGVYDKRVPRSLAIACELIDIF